MPDAKSRPRTETPPAAPPPPARGGLRPGARLGVYRVVGLLGRGGMGAVYLAERTQAGDGPARVALKVLPPHWLGEPERILRFQSEQALLARLDHPNVVRAFGGLERDPESDLAFYAMELVLGSDLGALLGQHGRFPPAEAARIGAGVAAALSAAHRERIVHRDIKPQNILLDRTGGVRLTDFGLARALDQSRLTRSGTALGTPAYMAPEQADGAAVGPAADLYGLGVVLYELLVGRPPFEAESPIALLLQHRERTPRPPRERRPEVPAELDALVVRLLEKDPAARGDAAEISDALRVLSEDLERRADSGAFRDEIQHAVDDRTRSVMALRAPVAGESALETAAPPVAATAAPAAVGKATPAPAPSRRVSRRVQTALGAFALVVVGAVVLRLRGRGPTDPPAQPASHPAEAAPATPKGRLVDITFQDGSGLVGRLLRYDQDALWVEGPEGALRRIPLARVRSYRLAGR